MTITHADDRLEVVADEPDASSATPQLDDTPTRPPFTIPEAATVCAVSRKTITRKLPDLAEHGAAKDDDGVWRIPVEALLAVGLHPGRSISSVPRTAVGAGPSAPPIATPATAPASLERDLVTVPRDRWDDLRIRLARAEAEAAERALALADARLALRALTAGPSTPEPSPPAWRQRPISPTELPPALAVENPSSAVAAPAADPATNSSIAPIGPAGDPSRVAAAGGGHTDALDPASQLASARTQAAQHGGYVPPAGALPRKKRWWHSK